MNARRIFAALVVSFAAVFAVVRVTGQDGSDFTRTSSGGVPTSRTIGTSAPLQGGGDLSSNRTISIAAQNSNVVLAGPTSGSAATPTFRPLVLADIPDLTSLYQAAGGGGGSGVANFFYGDGSDGALHFDGSTTIVGVVPSGNIYTTTTVIYASSVTIDSGVTVKSLYPIFCSGTATVNGTLACNGNNASGSTGASLQTSMFAAFSSGASGTTGTGTQTSANTGGALGSGGGGGGGASGSAGLNGTQGSVSRYSIMMVRNGFILGSFGVWINARTTETMPFLSNQQQLVTGLSGGRGTGDGTNAGGGAGGGGGTIYLKASTINMGASGLISANGGNGGNGAGGNAGGGGGGGGGVAFVYYTTATGTALVSGTNVTAAGGTHGNGVGTGGNGGDGAVGAVYLMHNQ